MLPKKITETQRQHPIAWSSLLLALIVPLTVGVTALGFLFKHLWPAPSLAQILAGAIVMLAAVPFLMLLGAAAWLFVARHLVDRAVVKVFFIYPGIPIFSRISEWMFTFTYGTDDTGR